MENNKTDQKIKDSLLKNTEKSLHTKEKIWENIERELNFNKVDQINKMEENNIMEQQTRIRKEKTKGKMRRWVTGGLAAAILLGIFSTTTNTGQALVNNIREFFAPIKEVVDEIEGMPEEKEVTLQEGEAGYIIYIDEERYQLIHENGVDRIVPKVPLDEEIYPEVAMEISQVEDKTPEELAQEIQNELTNSYETVNEITTVNDPVEGLLISAIDGNESNSPVTQVYVISNEKGGSFVIHQKYFLEAAEGHGARFHHMLKEFTIVDSTEE